METKGKSKMKFQGEEVQLKFGEYSCNNRIALDFIDSAGYLYTRVTTNLVNEVLSNENCAFIDTNNNGEEVAEWLSQSDLGKFTGALGFSGYCIYPEFEFKKEVVEKYKS